jgi:hypothetical protein
LFAFKAGTAIVFDIDPPFQDMKEDRIREEEARKEAQRRMRFAPFICNYYLSG